MRPDARHNPDSAFLRRLQFILPFAAPDEPQRRELWRRMWPVETQLAADVDFDFLARSFNLTGGHIRNIALAAAVRSYGEKRPVGMADIVHGTRREYEKSGKSASGEEFAVLAGVTANPRSMASTARRGTDIDCTGSEHPSLVLGRERGRFRANLKAGRGSGPAPASAQESALRPRQHGSP